MNSSTPYSTGPQGRPMVGQVLERVLRQAGCAARLCGSAVSLPSGLRLEATLLEARSLDDGRIAAATRIVAFHDGLFPEGLPDVQYAIGATVEQAMVDGFSGWGQSALVALEDAVRGEVRDCALLALRFPAPDAAAPMLYQAILGPIVQLGDGQRAGAAKLGAEEPGTQDEAPCPACMITRIQDALRHRLRAEGYTGVSLFAGRDAAGALAADCRVNGEPFPEGVERLAAYASAWPARGLEFRQQYVVVRPAPPLRRRENGA